MQVTQQTGGGVPAVQRQQRRGQGELDQARPSVWALPESTSRATAPRNRTRAVANAPRGS